MVSVLTEVLYIQADVTEAQKEARKEEYNNERNKRAEVTPIFWLYF